MASNAEMLRLVRHAAVKLQAERDDLSGRGLSSAESAMAYAEAILGMIGSCLMPDDESTPEGGPSGD